MNLRADPIRNLCITGVCIALCVVLPIAFHSMGGTLGKVFLPMHLPVLLCGLLCGWQYGMFCGILGPVVSFAVTSMPPMPALMPMLPELAVYGLISGVAINRTRTGKLGKDLYIALLIAMAAGRVAGGLTQGWLLYKGGESLVLGTLIAGYTVQGIPGILLQLVILPPLVLALVKAKVVEGRY